MSIISSMDVNKRKRRVIAGILFVLYFSVLFYFLFFSEKMGRTYSERDYHYNLVPFREIMRFWNYREALGMKTVLLNIVGNVVAFVPFGIFLPIFSMRCKRFFRTVLFSFELSFFVEVLQLATRVGSFDVDDLLLNTIGGMIGFIVYLIGTCLFRGEEREKTTQRKL